MFPWLELAQAFFRSLPYHLSNPFFYVILAMVYLQLQRMARLEQGLLGQAQLNPWKALLATLPWGFLGGLLGAGLFILLGLSLSEMGLLYVWPLALLLATISPHLLCFSYAGGVVGLSHLIFGWPELYIPALVGLVGVLHLVEAALIWVSGDRFTSPVYIRREGRTIGGVYLQAFWPLPLVALSAVILGAEAMPSADGLIQLPDWWPLIRAQLEVPQGQQLIYWMIPVMAALGYGDLAISQTPKKRAQKTARSLAIYSLALIGLAFLSDRIPGLQWLAILAAPIGHELLLRRERRLELESTPLYTDEGGVGILAIRRGSPGARLGLAVGDRILSANGQLVDAYLLPALWRSPLSLSIQRGEKRFSVSWPGAQDPGLVLAPHPQHGRHLEIQSQGPLIRWLGRRFHR